MGFWGWGDGGGMLGMGGKKSQIFKISIFFSMGVGAVCTTWSPGVCPLGVGDGGWGNGWGLGVMVKNRKFSKS